ERAAGWRPATQAARADPSNAGPFAGGASCPNGHPVESGDQICTTCGADVVAPPAPSVLPGEGSPGYDPSPAAPVPPSAPLPGGATAIDRWSLERTIS